MRSGSFLCYISSCIALEIGNTIEEASLRISLFHYVSTHLRSSSTTQAECANCAFIKIFSNFLRSILFPKQCSQYHVFSTFMMLSLIRVLRVSCVNLFCYQPEDSSISVCVEVTMQQWSMYQQYDRKAVQALDSQFCLSNEQVHVQALIK